MKKLIILLTALLLCLPALAETVPPEEAPATLALPPFVITLPTDVVLADATPEDSSVTVVHGNGATRVVAMVLSRVPDEKGDHAAELERLMGQFAPLSTDYVHLELAPGFHGLMAVTPGALEGAQGQKVDQVTVMVLWQTAMRGELLILSGYDMEGETARAQTMLNMLLRCCTVSDAPIVPRETDKPEP